MLLVADVHGAAAALRRVVGDGEPVLVLGDLINFIDYRTMDGILSDLVGTETAVRLVNARGAGRLDQARAVWSELSREREDELRSRMSDLIHAAYVDVCPALDGADVYVTYGNVDRPDVMRALLPVGVRFVDAEVVTIEGRRVGFAGGGLAGGLGIPGEVTEDEMAAKLAALGPVDVLCTHVAPDVPPLARDVVGRTVRGSRAVLDYLRKMQPARHFFGDVHQPQAITWRVGDTACVNVGYFRATGRAVRF